MDRWDPKLQQPRGRTRSSPARLFPGAASLTPALPLSPQYGFVNHALELLVIRNYGPEVWEDIK